MAFNRSFAKLGAAALALLLAGQMWAASSAASGLGNRQGKGYLGITVQDVGENEVSSLRLKDTHGAEIVMVDHDAPAGKAGLREHDVVLSFNGVTIVGADQLRKLLNDLQPGRSVSLYICRDGSERMVNATLGNRAEVEKRAMETRWTVPSPAAGQDEALFSPTPAEPPSAPKGFAHSLMTGHILPFSSAYTGATVDAMGSQLAEFFGIKDGKGLLVHSVEGNSPAAAAGLRAGDVVVIVNGALMGTEKDWARALRDSKGHPVSLTVVRDRKEQILTMVPDSKKRSSVEQPASPFMMFR